MSMPMIYLASNSPRRRELLNALGWQHQPGAVDIDENPMPAEPPGEYVLRVAEAKARTAAERVPLADQIVIAADTTVADGSTKLGKPADLSEAREMLVRLRGRVHQVYTAVVALEPRSAQMLSDVCVADVPMRNYSDVEIQAYIDSRDPFDKAGGYAIQHAGFHPVENFKACYACVVGLPICHLVRTLRKLGHSPEANLPQFCTNQFGYDCALSAGYLAN
jgi:septum formation protein